MYEIRIAEWEERYEVNDKGGKLAPGQRIRKQPLYYARLPVWGRNWGVGWRRLLQLAGNRSPMVFGVFCKALEFASAELRELRGVIRSENHLPACPMQFAELCGFPSDDVWFAIGVLEQLGWILLDDRCWLPELPENSGALYNRTEPNQPKPNQPKPSGKTPEASRDCSRNDSPLDSAKLEFGLGLRNIIKPKSKADISAFLNFERWAIPKIQAGEIALADVIAVADESRKGNNPAALFFSKVQTELKYPVNGGKK